MNIGSSGWPLSSLLATLAQDSKVDYPAGGSEWPEHDPGWPKAQINLYHIKIQGRGLNNGPGSWHYLGKWKEAEEEVDPGLYLLQPQASQLLGIQVILLANFFHFSPLIFSLTTDIFSASSWLLSMLLVRKYNIIKNVSSVLPTFIQNRRRTCLMHPKIYWKITHKTHCPSLKNIE